MAFDLMIWKERFAARMPGWKARLEKAGVNSAYAFLSAAALWPVVEAAHSGEWAALAALGTVTASVGGNLLANQIQSWKDETDAARQLEGALSDAPDLRAELDAVLEKLDALPVAEQSLPDTDKAWFVETIRQELSNLGSTLDYKAILIGEGAIAQDGSTAVGAGATYVGGDVNTGGGDFVGRDKIIHMVPDPQVAKAQEAADARRRYLERLRNECRILPLAALGGEESIEEEVTLDQVYIALNTRRNIKKEDLQSIREGKVANWKELSLQDEKSERSPFARDVLPLPALDAVQLTRRVVILGDPGAGKSTFVKKLLEMQANAALGEGKPIPQIDADLLPILIILRDLAPSLRTLDLSAHPEHKHDDLLLDVLQDHLRSEWKRLTRGKDPAPLFKVLDAGKVLLVLDGLDEVPQDLRPRVYRMAAAVNKIYNVARLIVTSRIRSYTGDAGDAVFPNIPTLRLRAFDNDQIQDFITGWYNAQAEMGRFTPEQAKSRAEDLSQAALSSDLRELASNPMMLTTMAIIHQKETGLPKERVKLYDLAVDVLTRRWQKRKTGEKGLSPSDALRAFLQDETRLRPALEHLAYEAHSNGAGEEEAADLPRGKALEILEKQAYTGDAKVAAEFLDYVDQRAGLLVGRGGEEGKPTVYSFPHRTFQEYLAGCYLASQRDRYRAFYEHAARGDTWDVAAVLGAEEMHYNRRSTNELLSLAYALCRNETPTKAQDWRAALWSGQMTAVAGVERVRDDDVPIGGEAYLKKIRTLLAGLLEAGALTPLERAEAGRALAKPGDPRFDSERWYLPADATLGFLRIPTGPFIMGGGKEQHKVNLPYDYWLAKYPVTNAQFQAFVDAGGYGMVELWPEAREANVWRDGKIHLEWADEIRDAPVDFGEPFNLLNHPAVGVTWYEALAYARWLDEVLKAASRQRAADSKTDTERSFWGAVASGKYRVTLPSEAEWEKAARGGLPPTLTPRPGGHPSSHPPMLGEGQGGRGDGVRVYPWGDEITPDYANYRDTGLGTTSAVGTFPKGASPYGALDMSGDVWEWTRSLYKKYPYPSDPQERAVREDLKAPRSASRVLRGGSFYSSQDTARCAARGGHVPFFRSRDYGFRVVLVPMRSAH